MKIICVIIKEKEKIMSDLSNITQFSGITITSDQTTGTNNPNATFTVANLTQEQIKNLQNVTKYQINNTGNFYTVKPGTMVFNITSNVFQIFINGQWQNLFSVNTTAKGSGLTNGAPLVYPSGTAESVEGNDKGNEVAGFTYYATDTNTLKYYNGTAWKTVSTV
jgi:hypothetical protein